MMRDYTKIKAWELADDLVVRIYLVTKSFVADERFALTSQVRRAAYSVAANIAEGAGRRTTKDYLHFLDMAMGSVNETAYFIHLAHRLGYLDTSTFSELNAQSEGVGKCLSSYIRAVEKDLG